MKKNLDNIYNVVVGTAGHIDHGKSSLVQRLTGTDPDRLPEEQSRGLTIDLGFASMPLPDGRTIGLVDVPGHERLIKNMVAGATGIDLVVLVVAADDSVMPQTLEHLTIMQILGLKRGMIAVTKIDLVEDDLRELVVEEIRETVADTFLADAPIVEVSSITGEGFDTLTETLYREIDKVEPRETSGVFRMPIQRVFSPKGFGTVVTGIPMSGTATIGSTLEIQPLGKTGRIRGIQAYKENTDLARAGHSTALNLSDLDHNEVHRGMIAAEPGYFRSATMIEARLKYSPSTHRPLLHQTTIRLHTGTAEAIGKVYLLESKRAEPGDDTFVQFRLEEPVVLAPGDRYIVRLHSPMETIGGGEILGISEHRLKTGRSFVIDRVKDRADAVGDASRFLVSVVKEAGFTTLSEKEISLRCGRPLDEVRSEISELKTQGQLAESAKSGQYFSPENLDTARQNSLSFVAEFFRENPRRSVVERNRIKQNLKANDTFLAELIASLETDGEATTNATGDLRWRDHGPSLTENDLRLCELAKQRCLEGKFTPPAPEDVASDEGSDATRTRELFDLLVEQGDLVHIGEGIYLHADILDEAKSRLETHFESNESITAGDAKTLLESTRKFSIPLLEYLDRVGFTMRRGDVRVMKRS